MDLKQIETILSRHGIKVDRDFTKERSMVAFSSPQVEKKYDYVMETITSCIVNGEVAVCKNNVKVLADLAVELQKESAIYRMAEFDKQITKEVEKIAGQKNGKQMEAQMKIKKEVIKYIESTVSGIEVLKAQNPQEQRQEIYSVLSDSEKILNEIKATIMIAADGKSSFAANKAKEIFEHIHKWRENVVNQQINRNKTEILKEAQVKAVEWSEKKVTILTMNAKEEEIVKYESISDAFETINQQGGSLMDYRTFKQSLEERESANKADRERATHDMKETSNRYGDNIKNLQQQKQELESENAQLIMKIQNEVLSDDEVDNVYETVEDNDAEIENLASMITEYKELKKEVDIQIREQESMFATENIVVEQLRFVVNTVDRFVNTPEIFVYLSENFDYVAMNRVAVGVATSEEIENITRSIEVIKAQIGTTAEQQKSWLTTVKNSHKTTSILRDREKPQTTLSREEKLAKLMARGNKNPAPAVPVQATREENKIKPMGVDEF